MRSIAISFAIALLCVFQQSNVPKKETKLRELIDFPALYKTIEDSGKDGAFGFVVDGTHYSVAHVEVRDGMQCMVIGKVTDREIREQNKGKSVNQLLEENELCKLKIEPLYALCRGKQLTWKMMGYPKEN